MRSADRRLQRDILARLEKPHRLERIEAAFHPLDVSSVRSALFELLAAGKVTAPEIDTVPLSLSTVLRRAAAKRPGPESLDTSLWPITDFKALSAGARVRYQQRARAIEAYRRGLPISDIEEQAGMNRRTLYRMIERANLVERCLTAPPERQRLAILPNAPRQKSGGEVRWEKGASNHEQNRCPEGPGRCAAGRVASAIHAE